MYIVSGPKISSFKYLLEVKSVLNVLISGIINMLILKNRTLPLLFIFKIHTSGSNSVSRSILRCTAHQCVDLSSFHFILSTNYSGTHKHFKNNLV